MSLCLLLIGDGRDEVHERSWASIQERLPFDVKVTVDDRDHDLGFAGAIAEGWQKATETGAEWVWHAEADFLYLETVPVERMIGLLRRRPELAQLSLKRQPWNDREKAAGGLVEADPDDFIQRTDSGDVYTEHRRYWTTNPSLYSVGFCHQGWPQVERSEGIFTHRLLEDRDLRFGIWGAKFDPPRVEHIGETRAGKGY